MISSVVSKALNVLFGQKPATIFATFMQSNIFKPQGFMSYGLFWNDGNIQTKVAKISKCWFTQVVKAVHHLTSIFLINWENCIMP